VSKRSYDLELISQPERSSSARAKKFTDGGDEAGDGSENKEFGEGGDAETDGGEVQLGAKVTVFTTDEEFSREDLVGKCGIITELPGRN
jgi:hypothetical protein